MLDKLAEKKDKSTKTQTASNIVSLKQQSSINPKTAQRIDERSVVSSETDQHTLQ
jgi:hypothetical protein